MSDINVKEEMPYKATWSFSIKTYFIILKSELPNIKYDK